MDTIEGPPKISTWRVFSCIFRRYDVLKPVLVRETVNSDFGENRELTNLSGGFRDCSTDNVITCTRIEANIEKSLSKSQNRQNFRVNYSLSQPFDYFDDFSVAPMPKTWHQLCRKTVEKNKALKNLKTLSNALQFSIKWERLNLIMYKKRGITTSNSIG